MANYVWYLLKNSHFVASRFSKARKEEILLGFRSGKSFSILAREFGCTPATVTRTLKSLIPDEEFHALKRTRKKSSKIQPNHFVSDLDNGQNLPPDFKNDLILSNDSQKEEYANEITPNSSIDEGLADEGSNFKEGQDQFHELVPLVTSFEWDKQEEVACQSFSPELLPETLFMLVDKTVEIDSRPLKEFSQWSFLPDKDQERLAIVLYSNQRSAKRSCSRNQRVLKIPDSSIFQVTMSHLISKGITRLILDDSLISIDS